MVFYLIDRKVGLASDCYQFRIERPHSNLANQVTHKKAQARRYRTKASELPEFFYLSN
jgi:hypothetical protein